MKTSLFRFCGVLLLAAMLAPVCVHARKNPKNPKNNMRLLYWNIQNGMWSGQGDNYDKFVEWVRAYDPDVCVWCEAQSIYKTGTADKMDVADRYLVGNWGELAARYGHKYWYMGGHRDNYPQVITSKYPIENVERIVGSKPDSVVTHGAGWARIDFVYCTPPLYERITHADVVTDAYTEPVRDPAKLSNFWHPSDHRPIVVDFNMK